MTTPDYRQPRDDNRYIDVRSDYEGRYHLRHDKQAGSFDVFMVCLPPYINEPGLLADGRGLSTEAAWQKALTTLAYLRSTPFVPLYPPDVFVPMGIIIATSFETVSRDLAIRMALIDGGIYTDYETDEMPHERRVAALGRAVALLRGMPLPIGSMDGWAGLKIQ